MKGLMKSLGKGDLYREREIWIEIYLFIYIYIFLIVKLFFKLLFFIYFIVLWMDALKPFWVRGCCPFLIFGAGECGSDDLFFFYFGFFCKCAPEESVNCIYPPEILQKYAVLCLYPLRLWNKKILAILIKIMFTGHI